MLRNGWYWRFEHNVNRSEASGCLAEVSIHARMMPFWKMMTARRIISSKPRESRARAGRARLARLRDFVGLSYPQKLDSCRVGLHEMCKST